MNPDGYTVLLHTDLVNLLWWYIPLVLVVILGMFKLMGHYRRQGNKRAQWVLVGVAFLLTAAHWIWPLLLL